MCGGTRLERRLVSVTSSGSWREKRVGDGAPALSAVRANALHLGYTSALARSRGYLGYISIIFSRRLVRPSAVLALLAPLPSAQLLREGEEAPDPARGQTRQRRL